MRVRVIFEPSKMKIIINLENSKILAEVKHNADKVVKLLI